MKELIKVLQKYECLEDVIGKLLLEDGEVETIDDLIAFLGDEV